LLVATADKKRIVPSKSVASNTSVIGARIREHRKALGLGLRDLAEQTGLTASFLSLVERNRASPSLDSLIKIADALDVPIFYFTRTNDQNPVVRRTERTLIKFPQEGLTSELLVPNLRGRLEVAISHGKPGTGNIARVPPHDAEECIYVLEGSVRVRLHEADHTLNSGDSITFHLSALREFHVLGRKQAVWMTIITPPVL
jgi:transcriptional regulator with XRE-family HTH domain